MQFKSFSNQVCTMFQAIFYSYLNSGIKINWKSLFLLLSITFDYKLKYTVVSEKIDINIQFYLFGSYIDNCLVVTNTIVLQ